MTLQSEDKKESLTLCQAGKKRDPPLSLRTHSRFQGTSRPIFLFLPGSTGTWKQQESLLHSQCTVQNTVQSEWMTHLHHAVKELWSSEPPSCCVGVPAYASNKVKISPFLPSDLKRVAIISLFLPTFYGLRMASQGSPLLLLKPFKSRNDARIHLCTCLCTYPVIKD